MLGQVHDFMDRFSDRVEGARADWVEKIEAALDGPYACQVTEILEIVSEMKRFRFSKGSDKFIKQAKEGL